MPNLRCLCPYSQWSASLAPAMRLFFVGVGREELLDLLDALYQGRQLYRETFERVIVVWA